MLSTLISRELLDNLMTFRFVATFIIMLLLVVTSTSVLINDYDRRLASYNAAVKSNHERLLERKTYSGANWDVVRPPNLMSIFNVGLDKRLSNEIFSSWGLVPTLWDGQLHGSTNPLLNLFTSIDIVFIFEVILSLMALIFAYDALAGERERGTLRLVLTNPVSRAKILLAKYISAMICLLVPLLISLLFVVIMLMSSTIVSLKVDDFLRIGGIVLSSIAYLSVFYLIGMLISVVTRRTSTALMLAMFFWGFLVLVYPNVILVAFTSAQSSEERLTPAFNQIEQIWEEFDRERKDYLANDPIPGEDSHLGVAGGSGFFEIWYKEKSTLLYTYITASYVDRLDDEFEPQVPHVQNYYRSIVPKTIEAAERAWLVRKQALESVFFRPAIVDRIFSRLSPVGMYDAATQAWAGTDLFGLRDFYEATRKHRRTVIDYLYDKDAFGDRQWFSADKGSVKWDTFPQFSFKRSSAHINAKRALPDLMLMLMMNLILFLIIFLVFQRSEV